MQRRSLLLSGSAALAALTLAACGKQPAPAASPKASAAASKAASVAASAPTASGLKPITIGVTAGTSEEVAEVVAKQAEKAGLKVTVRVFGDYVTPDAALQSGEIDLNSYQHEPFMQAFNEKNKADLVVAGKTYLAPLALYSKKIKSASEVKPGAQIAIPNDPSNGGRALQLLAKQGWIRLKDGIPATKVTVADIVDNPMKLKIIELEAPQLPRSLDDTTASVINAGYAFAAKLTKKDQIIAEDNTSPYVNIIAVKKGNEKNPSVLKYIEVFHTDPVKKFIDEKYQGQVIAAW